MKKMDRYMEGKIRRQVGNQIDALENTANYVRPFLDYSRQLFSQIFKYYKFFREAAECGMFDRVQSVLCRTLNDPGISV